MPETMLRPADLDAELRLGLRRLISERKREIAGVEQTNLARGHRPMERVQLDRRIIEARGIAKMRRSQLAAAIDADPDALRECEHGRADGSVWVAAIARATCCPRSFFMGEPFIATPIEDRTFGRGLRLAREAADLSLEDMALMAAVEPADIRAFEDGTTRPPSELLWRILAAIGMPPLLGGR